MKILFLIPARGGSKGIPRKNIVPLLHKPLIGYTLEECKRIKDIYECEICVSTDSRDIADVVESYDIPVPFIRPADISNDTASTESVMLHALNWYGFKGNLFDVLVILQPTSPLRKAEQIKGALELFRKHPDVDMVVSVKETKANPYFNVFEENENGFLVKSKQSSFTRRQDCPPAYEYNGAIYVININSLLTKGFLKFDRITKYEMSEMSSFDIDSPDDLAFCEFYLQKKTSN